jgi:hypothetical protein
LSESEKTRRKEILQDLGIDGRILLKKDPKETEFEDDYSTSLSDKDSSDDHI